MPEESRSPEKITLGSTPDELISLFSPPISLEKLFEATVSLCSIAEVVYGDDSATVRGVKYNRPKGIGEQELNKSFIDEHIEVARIIGYSLPREEVIAIDTQRASSAV